MGIFLELTAAAGTGGPGADLKITINSIQIIKFWALGPLVTDGTKIFLQGLSTQEEEVDVNDNYARVKQLLGGAKN